MYARNRSDRSYQGDNWPLCVEIVGPIVDHKYGVRLDDELAREWPRLKNTDPDNHTGWKPAITEPRHLPYARFRAPCDVTIKDFTDNERGILQDMAAGLSERQSARHRDVSRFTVHNSRTRRIRNNLSAHNGQEAVAKAIVLGRHGVTPDVSFRPVLSGLSLRLQALGAIGFKDAEIAGLVGRSEQTVRINLRRLRGKLSTPQIEVVNRLQAIERCFALGLFVAGSCYNPKSIYGS